MTMKPVFATFLLLSLLLSSSFFETTMAGPGPEPEPPTTSQSFCDVKCAARCAKAGRQKLCLKYCKICCQECNCVPSGTYGNKSECPCYRDKLNSKGKPKCP